MQWLSTPDMSAGPNADCTLNFDCSPKECDCYASVPAGTNAADTIDGAKVVIMRGDPK